MQEDVELATAVFIHHMGHTPSAEDLKRFMDACEADHIAPWDQNYDKKVRFIVAMLEEDHRAVEHEEDLAELTGVDKPTSRRRRGGGIGGIQSGL